MRNIFTILLLFIFLMINGCNKNLQQQIINDIEDSCKKKECIVRMDNITNFQWDSMIVFTPSAGPNTYSKLGIDYAIDDQLIMAFYKSRHIVYIRDELYDPEKPRKLSFELPFNKSDYKILPRDSAIFRVKKENVSGENLYVLIPITGDEYVSKKYKGDQVSPIK